MKNIIKITIIIFFFGIITNLYAKKSNLHLLKSISPHDKKIKQLRKEIKKTIFTIKSNRSVNNLPRLKFYKYRIKSKDTFWKILAQTSLNIDTLSTVNGLSSPENIKNCKEVFIPNMRGITYKVKKTDTLNSISKEFNIAAKYIMRVNNMKTLSKKYIFIPCAKIKRLQRSLFLGTGFASPLKRIRKTSGFGNRKDPFHKKLRFHKGVDMACPIGTPIYASLDGVVTFCGYKQGYGKIIIIKHSHHYQTYYGHLSKFKARIGQKVKRGELIAISGNTGRTTGPHLHFEVRRKSKPVNPGILLR